MHSIYKRTFTLIALFFITLNSTAKDLDRGQYLRTIDEQANYITAKNYIKPITAMHIYLEKKPFLLGAYDMRDGIENRIPNEDYDALLEKMRKYASPLASSSVQPVADDESLPDGLHTALERASYLTALAITRSFGKNGIPVIPDSILLGLNDAQSKDAPKLSAADEKIIAKSIQEKLRNTDDDWANNRKNYYMAEEKKFLANNSIKQDVNLLPSGVQYKILEKGDGKPPKANSKVTVNYRGMLLDGTVFDDSFKRGKPETFKLTSMIAGFSEGLTHVPAGSKVILYLPAATAYGEKGTDGIPPYAAILFEVELLSVKFGMFD